MDESLALMIQEVAVYAVLLPALLAILKIRKGNREQRLLSILVFISFATEFAAFILAKGFRITNLPLLHIYTVVEFGMLTFIFSGNLDPLLKPRHLRILVLAFTIFAVFNSIFHESIFQFNALARGIESVILNILILVYFYITLKKLDVRFLERSPLFWISSGSLIYFSGGLFIFLYSNYILESRQTSLAVWTYHAFLSIVLKLFFSFALWVKPKE